jgi:hypothetical protein
MVLDWRGLPRSAAEALGFSFGPKNSNVVKAPGAEISKCPQLIDQIIHRLLHFRRTIQLQVHLQHEVIGDGTAVIRRCHLFASVPGQSDKLSFVNTLRDEGALLRVRLGCRQIASSQQNGKEDDGDYGTT